MYTRTCRELLVAGDRKQRKFSVLVEALEYYTAQGWDRWVVHAFPWVVDVRGIQTQNHSVLFCSFWRYPT